MSFHNYDLSPEGGNRGGRGQHNNRQDRYYPQRRGQSDPSFQNENNSGNNQSYESRYNLNFSPNKRDYLNSNYGSDSNNPFKKPRGRQFPDNRSFEASSPISSSSGTSASPHSSNSPGIAMVRGRGAGGQRGSSPGGRNSLFFNQNKRDRSSSGDRIGTRLDEDPLIFLSRTLSSILRHNAERLGFTLMKGGFLYVDEILYWTKKLRSYTEDDVMRVVRSNDKQRFTIEQEEDGRLKIRANQGHTLQVEDLDLQPIENADDFPFVIHGTYYEAWEHIKRTGLNRMKRNHIHFAPGEPGQGSVISGMRSSCQVMIYLDLDKALKDGLKFFISSNNVILSTGDKNGSILPRYFMGAKDRRNGYRLDFDPNIAVKSDKIDKNVERKKKKKQDNKKGGRSNDDVVPPAKVQALDESVCNNKTNKSTESHPTPAKSSVSKTETSADDSAVCIYKPNTSTENHPTPDESFVSNTEASADDSMNESICPEETVREPKDTGILSQLETDYGDEDPKDPSEPDMEIVEICDTDISKCSIDDIMKEQPPFVVVTCYGENLGEEKSCVNHLLVGTGKQLFIFHLKNKSLMEDGHLQKLLMDTNITKVFFRIGEVSPSLINEYGILLNGVPIQDIEILHEKLSGQLPAREKEIIKDMGFHKKMFKKWSRKCQTSSSDLEDPEELKQQARMIYKMFPLFEKSISDVIKKILKKETFEKAMPDEKGHFLAERIAGLKLEQKKQNEILKKKNAENNPQPSASGKKTGGKGTAECQNNKKSKKSKKK